MTILPQKLDNKILSAVSNNGKTDIVPRSPAIDVSDDTATHLYHKSLDSYVLTHRLLETILQWFVILPLKDLQQDDIGTDADISDVRICILHYRYMHNTIFIKSCRSSTITMYLPHLYHYYDTYV